jgi:predicted CXXCH cytochrome family protein
MKIKIITLIIVVGVIFISVFSAMAASVVGSKHDMSNPGGEVCVHCHTPHFASTDPVLVAPLWNKKSTDFNFDAFTMYTSPTINTTIPGRPSGLSLACLGCHDSVTAPEAATSTYTHGVINAPGSGLTGSYDPKCMACHMSHGGPMYSIPVIGPNLTNDHPISMVYPTAAQDPGFFIPPDLQKGWSDVPLFGGKVECPTCHNVHDPSKTPFLRTSNSGSTLCFKCHNK